MGKTDTFAGRIKNLQGETSDREISAILKNRYGIIKSEELVKKWRNGERTPNADVVFALSDYYGVTADYLLGRDVPKSKDPDVKMICAYTGLSETAVEVLHYATLSESERPVSNFDEIVDEKDGNEILQTDFPDDLELGKDGTGKYVEEYPEGSPTNADLERTLNMRTVSFINRVLERVHLPGSGWGGESIETILSDMEDYVTLESSWIDDNLNDEKNQLITVHYGNKTLRGLRVWEVVKIETLAQIEKSLDILRNEHFNTMSTKKPRKRKQAQRNIEGGGSDG